MEFDLLTFSFSDSALGSGDMGPHVPVHSAGALPGPELWERPQSGGAWTLGVGLGCLLLAAHTVVLGILPVHVAVEHQLPPASRCVLVFDR